MPTTLCHGCGAVYATRRPVGPRYRWLLDHFEESLGRTAPGVRRKGKIAISSYALDDADRERLRRLALSGVFVSEHLALSRKDYLPALLTDRLAASVHVELLGSLLDLRGRRVLEVRSRLGSIPAALRRLCSADVVAMAIFEGQRFLIEEVYGMPASAIDFDRFRLPHPGPWDLIVCNHMLTHAVRPRELLATCVAALAPGGHMYFYGEPDDGEILQDGKSMFNTLNAFHLQTFDGASFVRVLAANGLETVFMTHHDGKILCLARPNASARAAMLSTDALAERKDAYLRARTEAILTLPPHAHGLLGQEWSVAVERAVRTGVAEIAPSGRIFLRRDRPDRQERRPPVA